MSNKKKVAILGGGMGGLATAFHLTDPESNPDWKDRYEVTVYTLGYRLGGKVASSRNEEYADRIEEHGIHIFANYYHNVFNIVKKCCEEINWEGMPVDSMDKLFLPNPWVLYMDYWDKLWTAYMMAMNNNGELPWTGEGGDSWIASPKGIVKALLQVFISILTTEAGIFKTKKSKTEKQRPFLAGFDNIIKKIFDKIKIVVDKVVSLLDFVHTLKQAFETLFDSFSNSVMDEIEAMNIIDKIVKALKELMFHNKNIRRIYCLFDFYATLVRGCLKDGVFQPGFDIDTLDDIDYIEWLERHGIDKDFTMQTPVPHMPCNVCFQYRHGDTNNAPSMSTASYILFSLRFLFGKGAYMYHFLGGSGETVMYPIYQALKKRGVKFQFFTKVTSININETKNVVTSVDYERQVNLKVPMEEYNPLKEITLDKPIGTGKWMVWRHTPNYSQIDDAQARILKEKNIDLESWYADWKGTPETLTLGKDFDEVVLAISVGAFPFICKNILAKNQRWQRMVEKMETIQTIGVQLWLKKSLKEMGCDTHSESAPRGQKLPITTGFPVPLVDMVDFADLIEVERWSTVPESERPKACIYFCQAHLTPRTQSEEQFKDHDYPKRQNELLKAATTGVLQSCGGAVLFPNNTPPFQPYGFDFNALSLCYPDREEDRYGTSRMNQQFFRVNVDPTERYVPAFPGTAKARFHSWESDYENLTLAGDWIYCGFNIGSIEAAGTSGALASYALTGKPALEDIPGYFYLHAHQKKIRASRHPLAPKITAADVVAAVGSAGATAEAAAATVDERLSSKRKATAEAEDSPNPKRSKQH